jgi:ABC-2 family transporter protein
VNFLPIAGRELRVAARKRSTFWLRVAGAAVGVVIGAGCLLLGNLERAGTAWMGGVLFNILTWLCLAAGLSAGLFFTSDALSEEKREGTLGLLFLTDLRGYDVVWGKLMATSLRGFYALLAVLPVIAVTLLMGGITGVQYGKSSLALVNGLFLSLAAGMLISAVSRDSQKALAATLLVVLLFSVGGPLVDAIRAGLRHARFAPLWSLCSPGYVLATASAWGRSEYWEALLISQIAGWGMLVLACLVVPWSWQERRPAGPGAKHGWAYAVKYGGRKLQGRRRRKLLECDPVAWLTGRERWQSLGLWTIALLVAGGFGYGLLKRIPIEAWVVWSYVGGFFTLLLYLCATSLACRFLVEARRSGLLELLLVTPVNERQIVRGQWRGLLRLFGLPVLLLLAVQVTGATLSQLSFLGMMTQTRAAMNAAAAGATNRMSVVTNRTGAGVTVTTTFSTTARAGSGAVTNTTTTPRFLPRASRQEQALVAGAAAGSAALRTGANLVALVWFGLWMGLTSRNANLATLRTLLFVQVVPWFVITFGTSLFLGVMISTAFAGFSRTRVQWIAWWPLFTALAGTLLATAKDAGFILWSRKRLHSSFREQATKPPGERTPKPPPIPAFAVKGV